MQRYKINDIAYPSPSIINGLLDKPNLVNWKIEHALKAYKKQLEVGIIDTKSCVKASDQVRDATANIGSELHNLIETFINIKLKGGTVDMRILTKDFDPRLVQMFNQFYVWQRRNVKRFIASESPVVHEFLCYAGTLDMIYEDFHGHIWVVDLKTGNAVYPEMARQVAAYKAARESMEGTYKVEFNQRDASWVKKFTYDKIKIDKIGILNICRDIFELRLYDYTKKYDHAMKAFEGLLTFYYADKQRRGMNNNRAIKRC